MITLIPQFPLVRVAILSQVLNGVLLPFVLVFMLLLANNSKLMGEYKISRPYKFGAWSLTAVIVILTVLMLATSINFGK